MGDYSMNNRHLFLQHVAQTSGAPVGLEIVRASGSYLYDVDDQPYLDLIGGISVCNIGHAHPKVVAAIQQQAASYLHIMVYGELIQSPQVQFAKMLTQHLPDTLDCVYFTNSGSEATEGALKLARRVTQRIKIIGSIDSYHGHTLGALSVMGSEYWRNAYRPLMPGIEHYKYNSQEFIDAVDHQTACVIIETIQAEAGVLVPDLTWLQQLRAKCTELGVLLIFDEIQCGFGRTGTLWGWQHFGIVPDILLLGKALGGGMPMGAFIAAKSLMHEFTYNPVLGHLTTFGGHPVCCAAGMAAFKVLLEDDLVSQVASKAALFVQLLQHERIVAVRHQGLLMAIELESDTAVQTTLKKCLEKGVFSDWFLFAPHCIRLAPPLVITEEEIRKACAILLDCLD